MIQLDESEKRLIILYILNQLNTTISEENLSKIIINCTSLNWIEIQFTIKSLLKDKLIFSQNNKYEITPQGKQIISNLSNDLLYSIRANINNYIELNYNSLISDSQIIANFKQKNSDYEVYLGIEEIEGKLLDLVLSVPSRELAELICQNFKENTPEIYHQIVDILINKRKAGD